MFFSKQFTNLSYLSFHSSILSSFRSIKYLASIISECPYNGYIEIEYKKNKYKIGHRWLRDNCRCKQCLDPRTFQRLYDTSKIATDIDVIGRKIDSKTNDIVVKWRDQHITRLNIPWILEMDKIDPNLDQYSSLLHSYDTWNKASFVDNELPQVEYKNVMESNKGIIDWIDNIRKYGFGIVNNCPILPENNTDTSRELMEKLGNLKRTFFETSGLWDINVSAKVSNTLEHADTAYTNLYLPPHVDGTYFSEQPGIQFFQIPYHNGEGGETILVDGFRIGEVLRVYHQELYDYLSTFPMMFHYYENGISLRNSTTIFKEKDNRLLQFTFNNNDRLPHNIPVHDQRYYYDSITHVINMLNDPKNQLRFRLENNQLLVTNNWRVLHGRTSFTGSRRLVGAYIEMNEFLGVERILKDKVLEAK